MNSKERVRTSLFHMEPDRVPYDLGGTTVTAITRNAYVSAMKYKGYSTEYKSPLIDPIQQIVIPSEENLDKLQVDTRRIGAQRIPGYPQVRKIINEVEQVMDYYGCSWERDPGKDLYFNQMTFPLRGFASLSESIHEIRDPDWTNYLGILHRDLEEQILTIEGHCCIADRNIAGLTENSLRLRGYEQWYIDTVLDKPGVERLLERILEDKIRYWDALIDWCIKEGCQDQIDVISECDDLGSQTATIIDPDELREIVIPRLTDLFLHLKRRLPQVKIFMHSCGAIRELIPDLIEAGVDILNPVQYTAQGMDLVGLKKDFGEDLVFWGGGIDTQSVLNRRSPEEVRTVIKKNLDTLAPGGGFIFAPVHNIQDDVPPANFWAMWETLHDHAKY